MHLGNFTMKYIFFKYVFLKIISAWLRGDLRPLDRLTKMRWTFAWHFVTLDAEASLTKARILSCQQCWHLCRCPKSMHRDRLGGFQTSWTWQTIGNNVKQYETAKASTHTCTQDCLSIARFDPRSSSFKMRCNAINISCSFPTSTFDPKVLRCMHLQSDRQPSQRPSWIQAGNRSP